MFIVKSIDEILIETNIVATNVSNKKVMANFLSDKQEGKMSFQRLKSLVNIIKIMVIF